ncbi:hypothetical protein ARMGADRAFT_1029537 [Armillaria gallica]|uniref:F-box domain-containing protein n=1 Tax=Armillaria gallica TaxID=47427 RepID=A0A2H3DSL0_ARMGA|nr:hypothetical protein ARMGADRAFT_1029537 [Armillaria gallica]
MSFDLDTLADGPFDFDLLAEVIDGYDASVNMSTRLAGVSDVCYVSPSIADFIIFTPSGGGIRLLLARTSFHSWCLLTVPAEVWTTIFDSIPHNQQLIYQYVSRMWCRLFTPLSHRYLVLCLPRHRPYWSDDVVADQMIVFEWEIDMSAMVVMYSIQGSMRGVKYINWPIFPYNFFLHLLLMVQTVIFEGAVELQLTGMSLAENSLEGILSPNGCLHYLYIDSIDQGALDANNIPGGQLYHDVRDFMGLTSFCAPFVSTPSPPTLRFLKLDLRYNSDGAMTESFEPNLHGTNELAAFVERGETFPLQTRTCALEELDLALESALPDGCDHCFLCCKHVRYCVDVEFSVQNFGGRQAKLAGVGVFWSTDWPFESSPPIQRSDQEHASELVHVLEADASLSLVSVRYIVHSIEVPL